MTDHELTDEDRRTLTIEAGLGRAPSILTIEAVEYWAARRQDAADLAAAGIRLVAPDAGRFVDHDLSMTTITPPPAG